MWLLLRLIRFWLSQIWSVTFRIREEVFSGCTVPPGSKETELGSSDKEASPSAGKSTRVVSVPCSLMEVRPYSYFWRCRYFWGTWLSFLTTDEFSMRVTKLLQWLVSHKHTAYLSIFNLFRLNELWPYNQRHVNQIIWIAKLPKS